MKGNRLTRHLYVSMWIKSLKCIEFFIIKNSDKPLLQWKMKEKESSNNKNNTNAYWWIPKTQGTKCMRTPAILVVSALRCHTTGSKFASGFAQFSLIFFNLEFNVGFALNCVELGQFRFSFSSNRMRFKSGATRLMQCSNVYSNTVLAQNLESNKQTFKSFSICL